MNTLYHYVHCPFCIRVRMAANFLKTPYKTVVLRYDDEKTPIDLVGKKICPIWVDEKGKALPESLDIISNFDTKNIFEMKKILSSNDFMDFTKKLDSLGHDIHSLTMPHWIFTKEFDEKSRSYFQNKKEQKRGPFSELIKKRKLFESSLNKKLNELEKKLNPYFLGKSFSIYDILVASHLWGLYVVPEFQFSSNLHDYLQKIKEITHFDYQEDFWKTN